MRKPGPQRNGSLAEMYFASVQILIETIARAKIRSAEINQLLGHERKRALLREFRHDLLHGGSPLSEGMAVFLANLSAVDEWTIELREACQRVVVGFFRHLVTSGGRILRRKKGRQSALPWGIAISARLWDTPAWLMRTSRN
jgi:hypothetical protein